MQMLPLALTSGSLLANVGAGIGAITSIAAGNYQSRVANMNAGIAKSNAARSVAQAAATAQMQDQEAQIEMGASDAAAGASGLSLGVGSSALKRKSLADLASRDRGLTVYQGELEKTAYLQQAAGYSAEGSAAKTSGYLNAFSSLSQLSFPNYVSDSTAVSPTVVSRLRPRPNPYYGAI